MTTLHYIFDPLCGWCYAIAPLVKAASAISDMNITLHSGGMMTGTRRQHITPQWRNYVMPHDQRIAQLSGQPFGEAYFEGLLRDTTAVMDSAPPTTAVLAAEEIAARGLNMLHRLQHAHYAEGRRIADREVLASLAEELGLDRAAFNTTYDKLVGTATEQHFKDSHQWLARAGGQGFPTFALEHVDGTLKRIDATQFIGKTSAWTDYLRGRMPTSIAKEEEMTPHCGLDGCTDS